MAVEDVHAGSGSGSGGVVAEGSGYNEATGIYSSKLPAITLPDGTSAQGIVDHIFEETGKHGRWEKVALMDAATGEGLTFRELEVKVNRAMALLPFAGPTYGDHALVLAPNSLEMIVAMLACLRAGAVVLPANPAYTADELERIFGDHLRFGAVFTTPAVIDRMRAETKTSFWDSKKMPAFVIGKADPGWKRGEFDWTLADMFGDIFALDRCVYKIPQNWEALMLLSSGTTGVSKATVLTHKNLVAFTTIFNGNPVSGTKDDDVYVCATPQFHVYSLVVLTLANLVRGATVVVMPKYSLHGLLKAVEQFRVTHLPLVPPILLDILNLSEEELRKYDLSSVTIISCGAAPLSRETIERCAARFPGAKILQGYGMTETSGMGATFPAIGYRPEYFGSVGLLLSNSEARVVDPQTGAFLGPNKPGELWFRSPGNMKGYKGNPKATLESIDEDGWLHSGDVGFFNEDGFLYIVDRIKEVIKYNGFQVPPAELEGLLLSHPEIQDAAVIPYPDDNTGEIPMAFVVRMAGATITEEDVKQYIADKVVGYKKIRKVEFIDSIPKLPSGKILRRELVQRVRQRVPTPKM